MKYIYHYHATSQGRPGELTNIDGIIVSKLAIDSMERYAEVKSVITKDNDLTANVIICSLSLLETILE